MGKKYVICQDARADRLEKLVEDLIDEHYIPAGGVTHDGTYFIQAMVLRDAMFLYVEEVG